MRVNPQEDRDYQRNYMRIKRQAARENWPDERRLEAISQLRKPKPNIKTCTQCGRSEPEVEFYAKHAECKECNIKRSKQYQVEHSEQRKEYLKEYRDENKNHLQEVNRTWRKENKDKITQSNKAWRESHKEEKYLADKQWREQNKEYKAEKMLEWQRANPDKTKASRGRRRAAKSSAQINDFTSNQWLELLEEYTYCCAYCFISGVKLEQDHIVPLSKGGNHTKSNVVPSCIHCNRSKNDKELTEWLTT